MTYRLRLATPSDIPHIEALIALSVHSLQAEYYSKAQRDGALGTIFGVDSQLIADQSYYVVEQQNTVVACGGWSRRSTLFGADAGKPDAEAELNPKTDAAKLRAFFVHPGHARRGLGSRIAQACEEAAMAYGFQRAELVATLAGEPLYSRLGYQTLLRYDLDLDCGESLPVVRMGKSL